ncbi:hypothetical protein ABBQ38_005069 [Trebouxia sp. C0009 RCD-2024]
MCTFVARADVPCLAATGLQHSTCKTADVIPSPATAPSTALCSPPPHRRSLPTVPPAANDSNTGMAATPPCRCAAGDADLSGLMLLCAATDTMSPPLSNAEGCAQLDKIAGLMLLCKAALGSPVQMVPVSPGEPSSIGSSSRRISQGSLSSLAIGTRAALSASQSRRPSWSIVGPTAMLSKVGSLAPVSGAQGRAPQP